MKNYTIPYAQEDVRWLHLDGTLHTQRSPDDFLFRTDRTEALGHSLRERLFQAPYLRHIPTGRAETEFVSYALLAHADLCNGIVGMTLDGLVRSPLAQVFLHMPAGRILHEVLEDPEVFVVSLGQGVRLPAFPEHLPEFNATVLYDGSVQGLADPPAVFHHLLGKTEPQPADINLLYLYIDMIKSDIYVEPHSNWFTGLVGSDRREVQDYSTSIARALKRMGRR